jgi:REP-associated tyrosine transposase
MRAMQLSFDDHRRRTGRGGPRPGVGRHVRALRTPREVRNALAYVLLNARKHWKQRTGVAPPVRIDEASSGAWFSGWSRRRWPLSLRDASCVATARTWLLRVGWQRHGLLDPAEVPGSAVR